MESQERILLATLGMVPRLLGHSAWREVRARRGGGLGVLLVPGFGCGDRTLTLTRTWLRARNYRPARARLGLNLGCTTTLVDRIVRRLEEHAEATGRRVVLVGQSRGGWLGRLAAARRPDLVRGLVMAGSPVLDPLGANPKVVRTARWLTRMSTMGVPGLLDADCFSGSCYRTNADALADPLPPDVPAVSIYSRSDRIAPWQLCQDPGADWVEISSSHTAMALHPDFYRTLEPRLAEWAATDEHATTAG
ncbi:alpha/beta hydrolase [Actinophytocola gossypii]|uniref:Alpha/beta hydrolase n=1 Tax=Actinophytocola gossypii TaxID=2812003 RepID=A0ABT2J2I6_9PSEU|nr:alpha/beta hydrolase [Actinophytocola gossypii]MCT2582066.1 alpha/beta hydrolase [Actinophytocola gossypii]